MADLNSADERVYRSLIEGSAENTLDDGEAATIACALGRDGVALIDEGKATRICADRFPGLALVSSVDLLIHPLVADRLGFSGQSVAVFLALRDARMNVPRDLLQKVAALIGSEWATECPSLPSSVRVPSLVYRKRL